MAAEPFRKLRWLLATEAQTYVEVREFRGQMRGPQTIDSRPLQKNGME